MICKILLVDIKHFDALQGSMGACPSACYKNCWLLSEKNVQILQYGIAQTNRTEFDPRASN